jgi:hypothetical protein
MGFGRQAGLPPRARSITVHVPQTKRLFPQLGVLVSIWMGHSPFEALA